MKKIDLECSNCGAIMEISDDKTEAFCPYCRSHVFLKKEESIEDLVKKEEKISYARKIGEKRAIEESLTRQKRRKLIIIIILFLVIFVISSISILIHYFSLEYMKNPFECVSIDFVGIDGNGIVKTTDNKKCENYMDIKFIFSKERSLKEGEKIRVTATSDKYRFGTSTNEYIVNGLSMYLISFDDFTEEMLNKLHSFSYEYLQNDHGITFRGEVVKLVPYKLFLYTNGENRSILYDVYKISIKTKSGNVYDKFVVAAYDNFVILNNGELFSYSRLYRCGNSILAGNPSVNSAISKDYAGYTSGFLSINDFKNYINKNNDGTFEIKER